MDESRIAPRRRMLKAGTIEFGGGGIDCIVRNLSETGAALEVVTPLFIPDRFTLFVLSDQFKRETTGTPAASAGQFRQGRQPTADQPEHQPGNPGRDDRDHPLARQFLHEQIPQARPHQLQRKN